MNEKNCTKSEFNYGGQAVMEGVMMRGAKHFSVAVRRINGEVVTSTEKVQGILLKLKWLNKPFLRGTLAMIDTMALGIKTLMFSANIRIADEEAAEKERKATEAAPGKEVKPDNPQKPSRVNDIVISITPVFALAFALTIFVFLPAFLGNLLKNYTDNRVWLGAGEGGFKFLLLLGYVTAISRMKEVRRVFQYHGAEHKTINAYEAGEELTVANVQKYSTVHVRCGTSFLLVVIITSFFVFLAIPWQFSDSFWTNVLYRFGLKMPLLPIVAGIAYEVIRFAGKKKNSRLMRGLLTPGLLMQRITTQEPTDDMVEVAIASLNGVFEAEKEAEPAKA